MDLLRLGKTGSGDSSCPGAAAPAWRALMTVCRIAAAGCVVSVGSLVATGCGGGSAVTNHQNETFVNVVHSEASDISRYRSDTELIRLGHAACDGFSGGTTYQQLADRLAASPGASALPSEDLGTVIMAAVQTFCPKYERMVG